MARELSNEIRYAALQLALQLQREADADKLLGDAKKIEAYLLDNEDKNND